MTAIRGLLWLEFQKSSWLLVGVWGVLFLLLPIVAAIPESGGGAPGDQSAPSNFQFEWSFESSDGTDLPGADEDPSILSPGTRPGPDPAGAEAMSFALFGRQLAIFFVCGMTCGILLLGFFFVYYRESDSGEIALLYQSPVSGDLLLWLRFGFMASCLVLLWATALVAYALIQQSQGSTFFGPVAEAFGRSYRLDWFNLSGIGLLGFAFPFGAGILLFCQIQNAYSLLNRQRLAGLVLAIAGFQACLIALFRMHASWQRGSGSIPIVHVTSAPVSVAGATPIQADSMVLNAPTEALAIGLVACAIMMLLAGRVWREVEWG